MPPHSLLDDLPPEAQARLRAILARLPPEWQLAKILPAADGAEPTAIIEDDRGSIAAQIVLFDLPTPPS